MEVGLRSYSREFHDFGTLTRAHAKPFPSSQERKQTQESGHFLQLHHSYLSELRID